jgi:hypothetical protein
VWQSGGKQERKESSNREGLLIPEQHWKRNETGLLVVVLRNVMAEKLAECSGGSPRSVDEDNCKKPQSLWFYGSASDHRWLCFAFLLWFRFVWRASFSNQS